MELHSFYSSKERNMTYKHCRKIERERERKREDFGVFKIGKFDMKWAIYILVQT
jgi:hypothetical protein